MTLTLKIVICCIVLAVVIATVVMVVFFSNWFRSSLGTVATAASNPTELNIIVSRDPSNNNLYDKFTGKYSLETDLSNVNIKIKANTNDAIVWNPIEQSMYNKVYTLTSPVGQTRRFAILTNEISDSVSDKLYICVFANTDDDVTMYAFGDSANVVDYNTDNVTWFRRSDGSSPYVTITS